jgi:hypothetical protein
MVNEPSVVATLPITPTVSAFAESDRPATRTDMMMDDLKTDEGVMFGSPTCHVLLPLTGMRFTVTTGKQPCLMPRLWSLDGSAPVVDLTPPARLPESARATWLGMVAAMAAAETLNRTRASPNWRRVEGGEVAVPIVVDHLNARAAHPALGQPGYKRARTSAATSRPNDCGAEASSAQSQR